MGILREKMVDWLGIIYGYGIMLSLLVGGLSFFGYLMAIILGGDRAVAICTWIYQGLYPKLVYCSSLVVLLGILKIYLQGSSRSQKGK